MILKKYYDKQEEKKENLIRKDVLDSDISLRDQKILLPKIGRFVCILLHSMGPGIEPGSSPLQERIPPLDQRCLRL